MEPLHPNNTTIGFIGLGVMGASMARNLLKAGYCLNLYTRTKQKAMSLLSEGANWQGSPALVASNSNIIITMVSYPNDVEEVYFGENGILNHIKPYSYLIDMTTSSPLLAQKIESKAKEKNSFSLDAPVSGGDIGAKEGKLAIMVGGIKEVYETVLPIFKVIGSNIVYQGLAGAGQHTKMCNQIALASNMVGVCEALVYAKEAGLEPTTVLQSIETGAAGSWALSKLAPRIINGDFEPGFYVKHFIKDMDIALDQIKTMDFEAKGLSLSSSFYKELASLGRENDGTQALYKIINDRGQLDDL
ncbi:NAD(P)-dependent oxidoreductase [Gracilibacillus sp. D59]|uniref:NAD(P)-dependent oxidoreductase n=1 Tax=Gracilibacillus sp. D59 TaxID=3457434 RepID=UPI003FCD4987